MSISAELLPKITDYYYTITGDVVQGDNKRGDQYTAYAEARFPINTPGDIRTQTTAWGEPIKGEISPLYSALPGMVPAAFSTGRSTPTAYNA